MTREEAIEILKDLWRTKYSTYLEADIRKALEMAIQALEQEPCEDAISRDAVFEKAVYTETEEGWCGYTVDVDYIKSLPSVKQEPKIGHCEDCKQFRKLPYHADTLGKCIHHAGFCPKGDWYCADFEMD